MQLTAKFKELNLDDAEFVCIKVIILLNPGTENFPVMYNFVEKCHNLLYYIVVQFLITLMLS